MDYLPYLRTTLSEPLFKRENEGVPEVIKLMDDYDIIKEDYDNIMEVTKWPNTRDQLKDLSSKVGDVQFKVSSLTVLMQM